MTCLGDLTRNRTSGTTAHSSANRSFYLRYYVFRKACALYVSFAETRLERRRSVAVAVDDKQPPASPLCICHRACRCCRVAGCRRLACTLSVCLGGHHGLANAVADAEPVTGPDPAARGRAAAVRGVLVCPRRAGRNRARGQQAAGARNAAAGVVGVADWPRALVSPRA